MTRLCNPASKVKRRQRTETVSWTLGYDADCMG
jgi:hypothetical protein